MKFFRGIGNFFLGERMGVSGGDSRDRGSVDFNGLNISDLELEESEQQITRTEKVSYKGFALDFLVNRKAQLNPEGKKSFVEYDFYLKNKESVVFKAFLRMNYMNDMCYVASGIHRKSSRETPKDVGRLLYEKMKEYIQELANKDGIVYKHKAKFLSDIPFEKWMQIFGFDKDHSRYEIEYEGDEPVACVRYYQPHQG